MLRDYVPVILLVLGGFLSIALLQFRHIKKIVYFIIYPSMLLVSLVSIVAYCDFGNFHNYGSLGISLHHYADIYHYAFGAKYYKELGNTRLYNSTWMAMKELASEGVQIPQISHIRSNKNTWESHPVGILEQREGADCKKHFSATRWLQFKKDISRFLAMGWHEHTWPEIFFDAGFNPPPSWVLVGSSIAGFFDFNRMTMDVFSLIDIMLMMMLGGYLVFKVFGLPGVCIYFIVLGNNWFATYYWTGGSFLRQLWFVLFVVGICALQQKRHTLAGVFFGLSAALSIFPVVFAAGAVLALLHRSLQDKQHTTALTQFILAFLVTACIMLAASTARFGVNSWREFYTNIQQHKDVLFVHHIGYKKLAVFSHEIGAQNFHHALGLVRFTYWNQMLADRYNSMAILHFLVKSISMMLAFATALCLSVPAASVIVGTTLLFVLATPANYYYIYMAILGVVLFHEGSKVYKGFRVAFFFMLLVVVRMLPHLVRDAIICNGYTNWAVYIFILFLNLSIIWEHKDCCRKALSKYQAGLLKAKHTCMHYVKYTLLSRKRAHSSVG